MMRLVFLTLLGSCLSAAADDFETVVSPFVRARCAACHNEKARMGNVVINTSNGVAELSAQRELWETALRKIQSGEMPPPPMKRPPIEDIQRVTSWVEKHFHSLDAKLKPDAGRVVARRLSRYEYNRVIRDLFGLNFEPARDFPADDSGYGFDNIGSVLSLSPTLMEKYLSAAERISRRVIRAEAAPKAVVVNYRRNALEQNGLETYSATHTFPFEGEYEIRPFVSNVRKPQAGATLTIRVEVDGHPAKEETFPAMNDGRRSIGLKLRLPEGARRITATYQSSGLQPNSELPVGSKTNLARIEINGPYNPSNEPTVAQKAMLFCSEKEKHCPEQIISRLTRRAWRRPATRDEVARLQSIYAAGRVAGDNFEQSMRTVLEAVLVSPHFLFRLEENPREGNQRLNDHALASRLSFFLWSSIPDETLNTLADRGQLHKPEVLRAQMTRMMADPKAQALAENFAGQWLQTRNLSAWKPDPDKFRSFDDDLRNSMRKETELFFLTLLREDRSVLQFLDADFTWVNEKLARHYGMEGIRGAEFQRVALTDRRRGGLLGHASILTVSSYPNRTSPVIRGKWILENLLNAAPPPPPPDVPVLDEAAVGNSGSLRQQMEKHRTNAVCASCHSRMDVLGFGMENFDAIGAWRSLDGKFPIDATGVFPNGKAFAGPAELRKVLTEEPAPFVEALTDRLLTYATGRGMERSDRPTVRAIAGRMPKQGYRFTELIWEIVQSMPFQQRRAERTGS
jgi:hypothetical protein